MTLWIYIFFTNNVTNFQLLLVRHFSSFLVRICGVIPKYPQQFPILSFCSLLFRNDCIWRANSLALLWFHCLIIRGHQAINSTESPSAEAVSAAGSAAACCSVSVSSPANTATGKSVYAHIASECSGAWSEKEPAQSAPTDNEVFGKVIGMAKARENIEYKSLDFTRCFSFYSHIRFLKIFPIQWL